MNQEQLQQIEKCKKMDMNQWAKEIHEQNRAMGWWDEERSIETLLMLVITEIAEATQAERKDAMDTHLPHRKGGEVELADALIRVLDIVGSFDGKVEIKKPVSFDSSVFFNVWNNQDVGAQHFRLVELATKDYLDPESAFWEEMTNAYSNLIEGLKIVAESHNYDIIGAAIEKIEYNQARNDHKREARAATGGKKF